MSVNIQSIHFTADQKLLDYIEQKLEKLSKYNDHIIDTKVILKLENSGQVKDKIVELLTKVPGETFVAKEESKSFEASFDKAMDTHGRQIRKHKEKMISKKRSSSH